MDEGALLHTVDDGFRGGAIVVVLLIAALLARDHGRSLAARLGAAFAIGVAAYAVCSSHGFAAPVMVWHAPILVLCLGNPVIFWLFARAIFDDGFAFRWWHAALWVAPVLLGCLQIFVLLPAGAAASSAVGLALALIPLLFAGLAVAQSIAGWRLDLVEGRRRLRVFVVAAAAGYIAIIGAVELALRGSPAPALISTVNAAAMTALAAVIAFLLLRIEDEDLFPRSLLASAEASPSASPTPTPAENIAAGPDRKLLSELERLMTVERAYRQEGLTIGSLALRLAIPEYKLRRLINQGLGYRNFTAFLNRYRIEEVKAALADPAQAAVPVLTIALDAGFQSLPPFNRAFKAETGLTPSDYRRRHRREIGT
jgi:AraC-like DNA-binding protein